MKYEQIISQKNIKGVAFNKNFLLTIKQLTNPKSITFISIFLKKYYFNFIYCLLYSI